MQGNTKQGYGKDLSDVEQRVRHAPDSLLETLTFSHDPRTVQAARVELDRRRRLTNPNR